MSCWLKEDIDAALKSFVSSTGHLNPKEVNMDTTCKKSTPMPSAARFTPWTRARVNSAMATPVSERHTVDGS
jgi:hypothetical protein